MKLAAIALLLFNVALLTWQYTQQVEAVARAAVKRPPLPAGVPPLVLLSEMPELPPLKEAAAEAEPAQPVTSEIKANVRPADVCIDVGPFHDEATRDAFRDWMRDFVAAIHSRSETVRKRQFFWVYLEPTSEQSAQQSLADLRDRGVEDYMLIRRGDLKNSISLGLFRSQDSVNRRLAELTEKGYKPVVVPRFETTDVFWVSTQLAAPYAQAPDIPASLLGDATVTGIRCQAMQTGTPQPATATDETIVEGLTD